MGGGGSKPQVQTYTPPPIDNSPAKNPIPNFFQGGSVERPPSPYQQMAGLLGGGAAAQQSPFADIVASAAPLLRQQQVDDGGPDILGLLQILAQQKGKR